jgi:hypothetical protein
MERERGEGRGRGRGRWELLKMGRNEVQGRTITIFNTYIPSRF